jgi:hypothetical protein
MNGSESTYEAVPYDSFPYDALHPDSLATIGTPFRMKATPVDSLPCSRAQVCQ